MLAHTTKKTFERGNMSGPVVVFNSFTKGNISYICKGIEKFKPGYKEKELDTEETEVRYFKGEKKGFSRKGLQRKCFGDVFPTTNESSM